MLKYTIKRVLLMLLTFLIIISLCFVLIRLLPDTDPDQFGQDAELVKQRRIQLGYLDEEGNPVPIMLQYVRFLRRTLLGGDWGIGEKTMYKNQNVWDVFVEKLPATVVVNLWSLLLSVPIGLLLGIYAALKKNKWQDHVISTVVMIFVSVPSYIYAFLVQYLLCFKLQWFPPMMNEGTNLFTWDMFVSMLPAIFSLSFGVIAGLTRYTRAELTEVLTSEFMLLARTKGLTKGQAVVRHALRNAMVVILPMIIGEFLKHNERLVDYRADIGYPRCRRVVHQLHHGIGVQLLYVTYILLHVYRLGCRYRNRHQLRLYRSAYSHGG